MWMMCFRRNNLHVYQADWYAYELNSKYLFRILKIYIYLVYLSGGVSWPSGTGLKFWCCQKTRMWVWFQVATLVSLSKTLNHNCFVLRMGRKAVGPVCCVMHVKEPSTLIVKRRGLPRCFWLGWLQIVPLHLVNPYKVLSYTYKWVS